MIRLDIKGNVLWDTTFGGSNDDFGFSVATTKDNGCIITGYIYAGSEKGNDVYLLKLDKNGTPTWIKSFDYKENDRGESVAETLDGGYIIVGTTSGDPNEVLIIKTDANGNVEK